jgi:hypothetical protein
MCDGKPTVRLAAFATGLLHVRAEILVVSQSCAAGLLPVAGHVSGDAQHCTPRLRQSVMGHDLG